jgi:hypothetical protein
VVVLLALRDDPGRGRRSLRPESPRRLAVHRTSVAAAVLERFQEHSRGLLPDTELTARQRAVISVPPSAPGAVALTAAAARGVGVTAALWAGADRSLTQRWAAALRRAGFLAASHGIQHDPTGRRRAVTLFDTAGEHLPYDDPAWSYELVDLAGDPVTTEVLERHGFTVTRSDPELTVVPLDEVLGTRRSRRRSTPG